MWFVFLIGDKCPIRSRDIQILKEQHKSSKYTKIPEIKKQIYGSDFNINVDCKAATQIKFDFPTCENVQDCKIRHMFISDNKSFLTDCKSLVWWHLEKDLVFPNLHVQHDGNRKQLLVWMKFDSRSPDVFFIFQMKWKREKWEFFCDKVKWRTVPGSVDVMVSPPCLQLCVQSVFGCWAVSFWLSSWFPLSAPRHIPDLTSDLWPADGHSRRRQTDVCIHFVCRKLTDTRVSLFSSWRRKHLLFVQSTFSKYNY